MSQPEVAPPDEEWTAARRRTLEVLAGHLAPPRSPVESAEEESTEDLVAGVIATLGESRFAGQSAFVWALLDEIDQRASEAASEAAVDVPAVSFTISYASSFGGLAPADREALLRALESEADPYLLHALRLALGLCLERRLAVRFDRRLGKALA